MLGWRIIVRQEGDAALTDGQVREQSILASWEVGGGLDWLDGLVEAGKATCLSKNGYPTAFAM